MRHCVAEPSGRTTIQTCFSPKVHTPTTDFSTSESSSASLTLSNARITPCVGFCPQYVPSFFSKVFHLGEIELRRFILVLQIAHHPCQDHPNCIPGAIDELL